MKTNYLQFPIKTTGLLLVWSLFLQNCGNSQDISKAEFQKVIPGDKQLLVEKLRPHQVTYKKKGGQMTYTMEDVVVEGKRMIKMNIIVNYMGKKAEETTYFDATTLAFVSRKFVNPWADYTGDFTISKNQLQGIIEPGEKSSLEKEIRYENQLECGVFEPALLNYYVAALPLKTGYKASVPMLSLMNDKNFGWASVQVLGEESIKIGGKVFDTWKVQTDYEKKKTIWIRKDAPYFVQLKTKGSTWKLDEVLN